MKFWASADSGAESRAAVFPDCLAKLLGDTALSFAKQLSSRGPTFDAHSSQYGAPFSSDRQSFNLSNAAGPNAGLKRAEKGLIVFVLEQASEDTTCPRWLRGRLKSQKCLTKRSDPIPRIGVNELKMSVNQLNKLQATKDNCDSSSTTTLLINKGIQLHYYYAMSFTSAAALRLPIGTRER